MPPLTGQHGLMKFLRYLMSLCVLLVVLGGAIYLFVAQVPEGGTGVRLVQGKRTDALLEHGLHGRVPYWYDVQAYPGMMFVSSLPLPMGAAAAPDGRCAQSPRYSVRAIWRIVDGRLFFDKAQTQPPSPHRGTGEQALGDALCAAHRASEAKAQTDDPIMALSEPDFLQLQKELDRHMLNEVGVSLLSIEREAAPARRYQ